MSNRIDVRKAALFRLMCVIVALAVILTVTACDNNVGDSAGTLPAVENASPDQATPDQPATPDIAAEETVTASVKVSEPAPTEPPQEYEFRWIGSDPNDPYDPTGFVDIADVIPDAVMDIRYYSDYNFVGERINGYEAPLAMLSEEAAYALKNAADDLREEGYRLIIYDAYRPQRAVSHFASWANDWSDTRMKDYFYPYVDKSVLFDYGYIAYYSGHSRGSKVDLSLIDINTGEELDMGGSFDYFDSLSHPDYTGISSEQYNNRMILRQAMLNNGFSPCDTEWWDFTLSYEPYPYTYFDFPVSYSSPVYK